MCDVERWPTPIQLVLFPRRRGVIASLILTALSAFGQSADWAAKSQEAKQAMTTGRFQDAVNIYRKLVLAFPDNPGLAMNLVLALHSASQYPDAIVQFRSAVKLQPQLAPAWFLLGVDLQKLNRPAEAVQP